MNAMTNAALKDAESEPSVEAGNGLSVDALWSDSLNIAENARPVSSAQLQLWANNAYHVGRRLKALPKSNEVSIQVGTSEEVRELNLAYRNKDQPTNVLSFPAELPDGVELNILGDIVICHDVVVKEARQERKTIEQHYAHMVVHATLHLCGYDHIEEDQADVMEKLEVQILNTLGVPNPYTACNIG